MHGLPRPPLQQAAVCIPHPPIPTGGLRCSKDSRASGGSSVRARVRVVYVRARACLVLEELHASVLQLSINDLEAMGQNVGGSQWQGAIWQAIPPQL